jgi:hypothetical protein
VRHSALSDSIIRCFEIESAPYDVADIDRTGLWVRVHPSGRKCFRFAARSLNRVVTIGPWAEAETPGHLTLAEARDWLERLRTARRAGVGELDRVVASLKGQLRPDLAAKRARMDAGAKRVAYDIRMRDLEQRTEGERGCGLARRAPPEIGDVVYFLAARGQQRIKIGHTRNIGKRWCNLECASPFPLDLVAWEHGDRDREQELIARFERFGLRISARKEWFFFRNELHQYCADLEAEAAA